MPSEPTYITPDLRSLAVPLATLSHMGNNPRHHGERSIAAIKNSLRHFTQLRPVVLSADGRTVIAGNGTLAAARALGWEYIAVVKSNLQGDEAMAFAIADNRTTDLSSFNTDVLRGSLTEFDDALRDAVGFTEDELDTILGVGGAPAATTIAMPAMAPASQNASATTHFADIANQSATAAAANPDTTVAAGLVENEVQPMGNFSTIVITGTSDIIESLRLRIDRERQSRGLASMAEVLNIFLPQ